MPSVDAVAPENHTGSRCSRRPSRTAFPTGGICGTGRAGAADAAVLGVLRRAAAEFLISRFALTTATAGCRTADIRLTAPDGHRQLATRVVGQKRWLLAAA